ncbi:hypothetical protein [Nostoc sp. NIES-3756]
MVVGLILIVIGLSGSLLVFEPEIGNLLVALGKTSDRRN